MVDVWAAEFPGRPNRDELAAVGAAGADVPVGCAAEGVVVNENGLAVEAAAAVGREVG